MTYSEQAGNLIFNSKISEGTGFHDSRARPMDVGLIVMSHDTAREIMREDISRSVFQYSLVKTEPDRCYGVRVAYDESMARGEMLVAELHGQPR